MSKRPIRPWDRRGIGRGSRPTRQHKVPFLEVDGIKFHSDRFYVHTTAALAFDASAAAFSHRPDSPACSCGASGTPPLFDRSKLVSSLDLEAAIVSTYTMDPRSMSEELPTLFPPQNNCFAGRKIPTLLLHGHRGLSVAQDNVDLEEPETSIKNAVPRSIPKEVTRQEVASGEKGGKIKMENNSEEVEILCIDDDEDDFNNVICVDGIDGDTVGNNSVEVGLKPNHSPYPSVSAPIPQKRQGEDPPEEGWRRQLKPECSGFVRFAESVYLTEVLTTWLPFTNKARKSEKMKDFKTSRLGVDDATVERRKHTRGVHHPKFMLLFERRGSVVVVVSTANTTKQGTMIDASWIQRFEPATTCSGGPIVNVLQQLDRQPPANDDFGRVFADFLQHQSDAAAVGQCTPSDFLRMHLNISGCNEFGRRYRFETAQVHLVSTVPGEYPGRHGVAQLKREQRPVLYGPQRVADILHRLSERNDTVSNEMKSTTVAPWIPHKLQSVQDRLLIQTTSFGGKWTLKNMAEMCRSYFGEDDLRKTSTRSDKSILDHIDILWPSIDFIRSCSQSHVKSPKSVTETTWESPGNEQNPGNATMATGLFLSSESFNSIELPCISRMAMYESSHPNQAPAVRSPHIKSFARLISEECLESGDYQAEEVFSWFMLTSACLSRGAQGNAVSYRGFESDALAYSNFELGVLFCSRIQGKTSDRIYCWKPNQCQCSEAIRGKTNKMMRSRANKYIHLPIPYKIRPHPYQIDPDDADLCATPFFHEIPEGTGCVGQMKLTPYGARLASEMQ